MPCKLILDLAENKKVIIYPDGTRKIALLISTVTEMQPRCFISESQVELQTRVGWDELVAIARRYLSDRIAIDLFLSREEQASDIYHHERREEGVRSTSDAPDVGLEIVSVSVCQ